MNYRDTFRDFLIISIGTVITASSVFFFLIPGHLSVGSVSGIAIIISGLTGIAVSYITMVLNIIFLILGFALIGREFGAKTVYTSILLPLVIAVLEHIFPDFKSIMGDPFLDMICYVGFVSIGLAILFNANASSGGLDIAAKILNKYLHLDLGTAMTAAGFAVALSSALIYDVKTVILSIMGTYLNGIILDHYIMGMSMKKKVCIISSQWEEIRRFIIDELYSGATIYDATGAYNFRNYKEIVAIVDRNEYSKLMNFVQKNDKEAFITVYTVKNIIYRPKVRGK